MRQSHHISSILAHSKCYIVEGWGFRWFSWGVASLPEGSVFRTAVCKIQDSECYNESLPLVLKDKRSCFSQGENFAVELPLDHMFALRK